jgi:hypothetical protein
VGMRKCCGGHVLIYARHPPDAHPLHH